MAENPRRGRAGDSVMSNARTDALVDECQRQSENCAYTATNFTIWLRWLRGIRVGLVVAPVIFGALAAWSMIEGRGQLPCFFSSQLSYRRFIGPWE
jgi:hypothetical protein